MSPNLRSVAGGHSVAHDKNLWNIHLYLLSAEGGIQTHVCRPRVRTTGVTGLSLTTLRQECPARRGRREVFWGHRGPVTRLRTLPPPVAQASKFRRTPARAKAGCPGRPWLLLPARPAAPQRRLASLELPGTGTSTGQNLGSRPAQSPAL